MPGGRVIHWVQAPRGASALAAGAGVWLQRRSRPAGATLAAAPPVPVLAQRRVHIFSIHLRRRIRMFGSGRHDCHCWNHNDIRPLCVTYGGRATDFKLSLEGPASHNQDAPGEGSGDKKEKPLL